jgi:hypothetical protein
MGKEGKQSKPSKQTSSGSSTPRGSSSSGTGSEEIKGWGLPVSIQKQLIFDLEASGGLSVSLDLLCSEKEDIYGLYNSKLRRKVQNVVAYWRSLTAQSFAIKRQSILALHPSPSKPVSEYSKPTPVPADKPRPTKPIQSRPRRRGIMDDFDIPFMSKYSLLQRFMSPPKLSSHPSIRRRHGGRPHGAFPARAHADSLQGSFLRRCAP